jgi:hypothetical protein
MFHSRYLKLIRLVAKLPASTHKTPFLLLITQYNVRSTIMHLNQRSLWNLERVSESRQSDALDARKYFWLQIFTENRANRQHSPLLKK